MAVSGLSACAPHGVACVRTNRGVMRTRLAARAPPESALSRATSRVILRRRPAPPPLRQSPGQLVVDDRTFFGPPLGDAVEPVVISGGQRLREIQGNAQ